MIATPQTVTLSTEPQPAGATSVIFYVSVPNAPARDMEVIVEYNYGSTTNSIFTPDFANWFRTIATIPAVSTYGSVSIPTTAPAQGGVGGSSGGVTGQQDSVLMARLHDGANYTPSTTEAIGVSGVTVMPDKPLLSISPVGSIDILESTNAIFEVTASPSGTALSDVMVVVTQTGSFIDTAEHTLTNDSFTQLVQIGTDGSKQFTVSLDDDSTPETNGTITATIQARDADYFLGAQSKTAVVRVQDNDNLPTLTIADATSVSESAGSVDFVVTADITTDTSLSVEYLIENGTGDDFIDVASPNVTETLSFTSTAGAKCNCDHYCAIRR